MSPSFSLAPGPTSVNIERLRWWARDHKASWGIRPVRLTLSYHVAVIVEDDTEQIAVVPFRRSCGVFRFRDGERRYLGDLEIDVESASALYDLLACPHCGNSGEVPYSYTNEAGHRVDDPLPCPCTRPVRDESF